MGKLVRLSVAMGSFLVAASSILTGTIFLELFNIKRKRFREGTGILVLMFLPIGIAEIILLRRR